MKKYSRPVCPECNAKLHLRKIANDSDALKIECDGCDKFFTRVMFDEADFDKEMQSLNAKLIDQPEEK